MDYILAFSEKRQFLTLLEKLNLKYRFKMQQIVFYWYLPIKYFYSTYHLTIIFQPKFTSIFHSRQHFSTVHMRNRFVLRAPMITSLGFLPAAAHYCVESHKNMICVHTKYSTLLRPIHHGEIFCSAGKMFKQTRETGADWHYIGRLAKFSQNSLNKVNEVKYFIISFEIGCQKVLIYENA